MTSRRFQILSVIHLFVSAFFVFLGCVSLAAVIHPKWRYLVADRLLTGENLLWIPVTLLVTGTFLTAVFMWLYRGRFVQLKLDRGDVRYETELLRKLVEGYWRENHGQAPEMAIESKERIEIFTDDAEHIYALSTHLENTLGFSPAIIITSKSSTVR